MKIISNRLLLVIVILLVGCGKKDDPVPKNIFNTPSPADVSIKLDIDGVRLTNNSDNHTLFVEKERVVKNFFFRYDYERVTLISPKMSYIDTNVIEGREYLYRFYTYNSADQSYSKPTMKSVMYEIPVRIDNISVKIIDSTLCVEIDDMRGMDNVIFYINGKFIYEYNEGDGEYCAVMPSTIMIDFKAVPHRKGYDGVPYTKDFKRDPKDGLFPPQNLKVVQTDSRAILSWDKLVGYDEYNIYVDRDGKQEFFATTTATIFSYSIPAGEECATLKLSSVKDGDESSLITVVICR